MTTSSSRCDNSRIWAWYAACVMVVYVCFLVSQIQAGGTIAQGTTLGVLTVAGVVVLLHVQIAVSLHRKKRHTQAVKAD